MNESHGDWTATLTLCNDSDSPQHRTETEHFVLSKKNPTFLGRSTECQIILRSKYATVSRYHAKLEFVDLEDQVAWKVCDLETPNGTFVNDKRIEGCQPIKSGDRLTLGKPKGAQFIFEYNRLDAEDLVDLFNKDQPYKQTYVPDFSEEERTELMHLSEPKKSRDFKAEVTEVSEISTAQDPQFLPESSVPQKHLISRLNNLSAKNLLGLFLLLLGASSIIYGLTKFFEANNNNSQILKSYTDDISGLVLNKNLDSLDPLDQEARKARVSANSQIRTALRSLDGPAKGNLMRFLYDSKLIQIQPSKLSSAWLAHKGNFSNIGPIELSSQDQQSPQLIYSRQFPFVNLKSPPSSAFLINSLESNKKQQNKNNSCKSQSTSNQFRPDCSWGLAFNSQLNEPPFITPIQLSGSDLIGVVLKDAPLEGINFEGTYLSSSECPQNSSGNFLDNMRNGRGSQDRCSANLSNAGLQNARLYRSVLRSANLSNAKLDYADLRQADLRNANLKGVQWTGAILSGACYLNENWQANFPTEGPDGLPFNPSALGMKAMSSTDSDPNRPDFFKECRNNL